VFVLGGYYYNKVSLFRPFDDIAMSAVKTTYFQSSTIMDFAIKTNLILKHVRY